MSSKQVTPELKAMFVEHIACFIGFNTSCKAMGIARQTLHAAMAHDLQFKKQVEQARLRCTENLEQSLFHRAMTADTTAAIFMLKSMKPDTYGDKLRIDATNRTEIVVDLRPAEERGPIIEVGDT